VLLRLGYRVARLAAWLTVLSQALVDACLPSGDAYEPRCPGQSRMGGGLPVPNGDREHGQGGVGTQALRSTALVIAKLFVNSQKIGIGSNTWNFRTLKD
jgi:hypothetical protein